MSIIGKTITYKKNLYGRPDQPYTETGVVLDSYLDEIHSTDKGAIVALTAITYYLVKGSQGIDRIQPKEVLSVK